MILGTIGRFIWDAIPEENKEQMINAAKTAAKDQFENVIMRKMTIEEWADTAIKSVDKIKDENINEYNLKYVSGRLCFHISEIDPKKVVISFELYFLNEDDEWEKVENKSEVKASKFTPEALEELKTQGKVEFEVKG